MSTDIDFDTQFQSEQPVGDDLPPLESLAEPQDAPAAPKPRKSKRAAQRPSANVSDEAKAAKAAAERDRQTRKRLFAAIERHRSMSELDDDSLDVAARLLGCKTDPAEVAVFSLTSAPNIKALSCLDSLRPSSTDPEAVMDALVEAVGVAEDKPLLRSVWALLSSVDSSLSAKAPTGDPVHAGRDLAKAARDVDPEGLARLHRIAALIS